MLFLTRKFGITSSENERDLAADKLYAEQIVEKVLLMQKLAAEKDHRPLGRGTHAKGVTVRAQFEALDMSIGHDATLTARLARGIFAKPGIYPATIRFANSDSREHSDMKPDVRSLSFSVELPTGGRQDFSMQNATTLPINDARAFLATMKVLTAPKPAAGLWSLPFNDKLRVIRTLTLAGLQTHQKVKPYQQLRYWSTVPFRHGPLEAVKHTANPSPRNPAQPLQKRNPKALKDELIRHVNEDSIMSSFDFGIQFLDADKMTYRGRQFDSNFWLENASVEWKESESPFHNIGKLTLLPKSPLSPDEEAAVYFDVTGNSTPDSTPLGSINRARWASEVASRKARNDSQMQKPSAEKISAYGAKA
jgi:catalase